MRDALAGKFVTFACSPRWRVDLRRPPMCAGTTGYLEGQDVAHAPTARLFATSPTYGE